MGLNIIQKFREGRETVYMIEFPKIIKKVELNLEESQNPDLFKILKFFTPKTLKIKWSSEYNSVIPNRDQVSNPLNSNFLQRLLRYLKNLPCFTKIKITLNW